MKSLSAESLNLIAGCATAVALIFGIIAIYLYNRGKHVASQAQYDVDRLTDGLNSKQAEINKMDIEVSKTKSELKAVQTVLEARNLELAELEGKLEILKTENAKLLKAAEDDVTVNIKAEDVVVPVERKKRPYFKKKKNAGSTTSKPKMGKA